MMVKSNELRKQASKGLNGEKLNSVLAFIVMAMVSKFKVTTDMINIDRISTSQN
jgi:hypothetical protein